MPYYNRDPKRNPNFENHPYRGLIDEEDASQRLAPLPLTMLQNGGPKYGLGFRVKGIITNTVLGVPSYDYSVMSPLLTIKAPNTIVPLQIPL